MSARTHFAAWGLLSLVGVSIGLAAGLVAAVVENGLIVNFSVVGIPFFRNALWFSAAPITFGFAVGWLALRFGRQLTCERCGGQVLPPDEFGFRGLQVRPIINAVQGRDICPACSKSSYPHSAT